MSETVVTIALLLPLAVIITYYDVRYRRIPNAFVLATLAAGVAMNGIFGGLPGIATSFMGCVLGFVLMFMLHIFGAMGAETSSSSPRLERLRVPRWWCLLPGRHSNRWIAGSRFDCPRGSGDAYDASSAPDIYGDVARVADAKIRGSHGPQTYDSLRCSHHDG